jgi:enamine deaminase RidA (YjgF/YER057c/UK114 family)
LLLVGGIEKEEDPLVYRYRFRSCDPRLSVAGEGGSIPSPNAGKLLPTTRPISEAARVGHLLYLSGPIGADPGRTKRASGGAEVEGAQTLENKGELT